jgi:hypothetical protein
VSETRIELVVVKKQEAGVPTVSDCSCNRTTVYQFTPLCRPLQLGNCSEAQQQSEALYMLSFQVCRNLSCFADESWKSPEKRSTRTASSQVAWSKWNESIRTIFSQSANREHNTRCPVLPVKGSIILTSSTQKTPFSAFTFDCIHSAEGSLLNCHFLVGVRLMSDEASCK